MQRTPFTVWLTAEERRRLEDVRRREQERGVSDPSLSNVARSLLARGCAAELERAESHPPKAA